MTPPNEVTDKRILSMAYINRIKGQSKRNYALVVLNWYIQNKPNSPTEPNSLDGVKYFEGQSVREKLYQIWENE